MTRNLLFSAMPLCMALQLAAPPTCAVGQEVFGSVDGVARDSASKQPLAQVRITAHNVTRNTDSTAISGSNGSFAIAKLEPGLYRVAAARDGFSGSTANVEVAANRLPAPSVTSIPRNNGGRGRTPFFSKGHDTMATIG